MSEEAHVHLNLDEMNKNFLYYEILIGVSVALGFIVLALIGKFEFVIEIRQKVNHNFNTLFKPV